MARRTTTLEVRRTERITPHMIRVVAGGAGLAEFPDTPYTDRYVKILFPRPGVAYPEPFDMEAIWAALPREQWPAMRTYTVRALDHAAGELTIDFVHHGDTGLAGPWAAAARPGDVLRLLGPGWRLRPGPGGRLAPDGRRRERAAGDRRRLRADAGRACRCWPLLEVADAAERQPLAGPGRLDVTWLYRDGDRPTRCSTRCAARPLPPGRVHAFVHGEAGWSAGSAGTCWSERGVARETLSVSGYWRRGRDEDGWRADKAAERRRGEGGRAGGRRGAAVAS